MHLPARIAYFALIAMPPTFDAATIRQMPMQVTRLSSFGAGAGAGAGPFQISTDMMTIALSDGMKVHGAGCGGKSYAAASAIDGDNSTQAWMQAPRKGSYIDVNWGVGRQVTRVVLLEHDIDFCKRCSFRWNGMTHNVDNRTGEAVDLRRVPTSSIRIFVDQSQIVWWQLFEILVWTADNPTGPSRRLNEVPVQTKDAQGWPVPPSVKGAQHMELVCLPACQHGRCKPAASGSTAAKVRVGPQQLAGECECIDSWTDMQCGTPVCEGCEHGVCVAPNQCRCEDGWSGAKCNMHGYVAFGSQIVLRVMRSTDDVL